MHAMVDLPEALRPVIQTVTPFCPSSCSRSDRVTEPSCQVMFVAFCSAIESSLFLEKRRAEIAFAEARQHDDDHLALVLRSCGDLRGGGDVSAGADPAEQTLFL